MLEPTSLVTGVDNLLTTMISEIFDEDHPTGCLITYSAAGIDSHSEQIRDAIRRGHEITIDGLNAAIKKAIELGEIRSNTNVDALALFILNNFQGTMVLSKTIGSEENLNEVKDTILNTIRSYGA